jgi:hypothetical protein
MVGLGCVEQVRGSVTWLWREPNHTAPRRAQPGAPFGKQDAFSAGGAMAVAIVGGGGPLISSANRRVGDSMADLESLQRAFCRKHGVTVSPPRRGSRVGTALHTLAGRSTACDGSWAGCSGGDRERTSAMDSGSLVRSYKNRRRACGPLEREAGRRVRHGVLLRIRDGQRATSTSPWQETAPREERLTHWRAAANVGFPGCFE